VEPREAGRNLDRVREAEAARCHLPSTHVCAVKDRLTGRRGADRHLCERPAILLSQPWHGPV